MKTKAPVQRKSRAGPKARPKAPAKPKPLSTPKSGTFDIYLKRHTPNIACFNRATVPLGVDYDALIDALQVFIDEHVAPVWGTPAKLVRTHGYRHGWWALAFFDHSTHARRLAYHDLTPDGYPHSKVYVQAVLRDAKHVSVAASHEIVEMLVDPSVNLVTMRKGGRLAYGYESADPVEDMSFLINGIPMTDFVYPTYFEAFHKPGSVQFDHMNVITRPFEIHHGGYQGVFVDGKWVQRFGSHAKRSKVAKEDRSGKRHERRVAGVLKKSSRKHLPPAGK